jgi:excisionase family DNA binding protein
MLKPLFTQEEVAAFLHCSEATVRRLVDRKSLGCHFINRARRFTQAHLDEYLRLVASRPPKKRTSLPPIPKLAEVWRSLILLVRRERPLISMFLEEGRLTEIDTRTGRVVLAFQADRQRVIESFRQADNRYFLQHCLQEILRRRLKIEAVAVESLIPELVPAVSLEA